MATLYFDLRHSINNTDDTPAGHTIFPGVTHRQGIKTRGDQQQINNGCENLENLILTLILLTRRIW